MVEKPSRNDLSQYREGRTSYSAPKTGFPAAMKRSLTAHSRYWKHCSLTAKS